MEKEILYALDSPLDLAVNISRCHSPISCLMSQSHYPCSLHFTDINDNKIGGTQGLPKIFYSCTKWHIKHLALITEEVHP